MKKFVLIIFFTLLFSFNSHAQKNNSKKFVRIAKITVNQNYLDEYKSRLKQAIETSMRLEKGVLTLFASFEKEHPNRATILEIYADEAAYKSHVQTPHFLKYKSETLKMVESLELTDVEPLIPYLKIK